MSLANLLIPETIDTLKTKIVQYCKDAGLKTTSWITGEPVQQILGIIVPTAIYQFASLFNAAIRGGFLEYATDPGDDDNQEPAPGWLSEKGLGDFGTQRGEYTFATGFVTLTNNGTAPHEFGPDEVVFQNSVTQKTYRNSYDANLYPEPNRTLILLAGQSVDIPIACEVVGTDGNAAINEISIVVSGLLDVSCDNASPVLGLDREPRADYIARCRDAASATSPNGPSDAYRYIALSANKDGTLGGEGKTRVNVNRVFVTKESTIGIVNVTYASPSGAPDPADFAIVDGLVAQYAVPDCVTYTGYEAVPVNVAISYSVDATPGDPGSGITAQVIKDAIEARLTEYFKTIPITGYQIIGAQGKLFLSRLVAEIVKAHPNVYACTISSPASDVILDIGEVAVLGTLTGTVVFAI